MFTTSLNYKVTAAAILVCITLALPSTLLASTDQRVESNADKLQQVGEARLTKLFWTIYESRLYTTTGTYRGIEPDLVLEITYQRKISSEQLINSTRSEWQAMSLYTKVQSESWLEKLENIWPDVTKGDVLRLQVDHDMNSHFYFNGRPIGSMEKPEFTRHFLAIWLSPDSRYSELQQQLTGTKTSM